MGLFPDNTQTNEDVRLDKFRRTLDINFKADIDGLSFLVDTETDVSVYKERAQKCQTGYDKAVAEKQYKILKDAVRNFVVGVVVESVPENKPEFYGPAFQIFNELNLLDYATAKVIVKETLDSAKKDAHPIKARYAQEKEKKWLGLIERLNEY